MWEAKIRRLVKIARFIVQDKTVSIVCAVVLFLIPLVLWVAYLVVSVVVEIWQYRLEDMTIGHLVMLGIVARVIFR